MTDNLTTVLGATPRHDEDGREIVDVMTCGTCGRSWNDAATSSVTPVPSGRCPFENEHADEDDATPPTIWLQEEWLEIDGDKRYGLGASGVYDTGRELGERGKLYRELVKEYGRCTGRVYIDTPDGARAIGWTFLARCEYDDSPDTFLRETWVTLHTAPELDAIRRAVL